MKNSTIIKLVVLLLIFITGYIILSIKSSTNEHSYQEDFLKNKLPFYCKFLKELEFVGEIITVKKTFSSGQDDIIILKCSKLDYPQIPINNEYFRKLNDSIIEINIDRMYTRRMLESYHLVNGDILKSDKGVGKIYRVTSGKEKIEIEILIKSFDCKCN